MSVLKKKKRLESPFLARLPNNENQWNMNDTDLIFSSTDIFFFFPRLVDFDSLQKALAFNFDGLISIDKTKITCPFLFESRRRNCRRFDYPRDVAASTGNASRKSNQIQRKSTKRKQTDKHCSSRVGGNQMEIGYCWTLGNGENVVSVPSVTFESRKWSTSPSL